MMPAQPVRSQEGSPGTIYYGWVLVTSLAVAELTSWGVLYYAFTVFLDPMHQTLGWSHAEIAGAFSLALLLSGLVGLPLGRWLDRHGPRLLMSAGSCVAVALLLAWSQVQTLAAFYLIWSGLGIAMAAILYEPAFWVVSAWFVRRRGQALTLLTLIAGLASVIYIPLAGWLVAVQGWRHALVVLAVLVGVGTLPTHVVLLRRRPEDLGLAPDGAPPHPPVLRPDSRAEPDVKQSGMRATEHLTPGITARQALGSTTFWLVTGAFACSTLCTGVVFVYLTPYLVDRGYTPVVAASLVGLVGLAALPGRLVLTPLGDRVPRGYVVAGILLAQAVALVVLLAVPSTVGVVVFIALFGAGFGAVTPARAALVADYYGAQHFGSINGIVAMAVTLARALAPIGAGAVYMLLDGYGPILAGLALLVVLGALALLLVERLATRNAALSRVR
jgi:MFS family permease